LEWGKALILLHFREVGNDWQELIRLVLVNPGTEIQALGAKKLIVETIACVRFGRAAQRIVYILRSIL